MLDMNEIRQRLEGILSEAVDAMNAERIPEARRKIAGEVAMILLAVDYCKREIRIGRKRQDVERQVRNDKMLKDFICKRGPELKFN